MTPLIVLLVLPVMSCRDSADSGYTRLRNENTNRGASGVDAADIIKRNLALDDSQDSRIKLRAQLTDAERSRTIRLTMYRKHQPDGRVMILIEFTSPPEERDRDGLVTAFPDGRIEAVRYVQSTNSFIVVDEATNEDALFGLTPQELADGQPEKYDFTMAGEDSYEGTPVYRLEGKLKPGSESKFFRMVLSISREDFTLRQAEFYDKRGEILRRLNVAEIKVTDGHPTRTRWTIDNRARQKQIDFEAVEVKYDQNLSDAIFTREHLKKIASR